MGAKVEANKEAPVNNDPIMYTGLKPNLLVRMAAIGLLASTNPTRRDPTKDITAVLSLKYSLSEGRIIPNDRQIPPVVKLPKRQAIQTTHPQPPSGTLAVTSIFFSFLLLLLVTATVIFTCKTVIFYVCRLTFEVSQKYI